MAADLHITMDGTPTPVYLGENATLALLQATRAEAAADAAAASEAVALAAAGPNYADTAAGLLATSEGDTFAVEDDGIVTVFRHDAGPTATELRVLPTTAALASPDTGKGDDLVVHSDGAKVRDKITDLARSMRGQPDIMVGSATDEQRTANTAALQAIIEPGPDATRSREVLLPGGHWEINSGLTYDEATTTHSRLFRGSGAGYGSVTYLKSAATSMFTVGDGSFEMFGVYLRDHQFDAENNVTDSVLRYDVGNFLYWDSLRVYNFGGAAGLKLTATKPGGGASLMQEVGGTRMHFMCSTADYGTAALDFELTGNADFFLNNYEVVVTAAKLRGKNSVASHREFGGHVERIKTWAIDAQDAHLWWSKDVTEGGVWLGDGCIGCSLELHHGGSNGDPVTSYGVFDNGFANRISRAGILTPKAGETAKSLAAQGHQQDGLEWLRVPGHNPYPVFEDDGASWTASNCTASGVPSPIMHPDLRGAAAVRLTATDAGGYIERSFYVVTSIDHLGVVGLQFNKNTASCTIALLDGSDNVLASKTVTGMDADAADSLNNVFRFAKVLATDSQITTATLKLRITLTASGDQVLCWFADVKPSESKHESGVSNSDSSAGSNAAKTYTRSLVSTPMDLASGTSWPKGCGMIARGLIDVTALGANDGFLGVGSTSNAVTQRQNQRLPAETGEREYTAIVPKERVGVLGSKLSLYAFGGSSSTVELSETSTHLVYPEVHRVQLSGVIDGLVSKTYSTAPHPRTIWMPFNGSQFLVEGAALRLLLNTSITADATNYWRIDVYSKNGGGSDIPLLTWTTASAGWSTGATLSLGNADFATTSTPTRLINGSRTLGIRLIKNNSPAEDFDGTATVLVQGRLFEAAGK